MTDPAQPTGPLPSTATVYATTWQVEDSLDELNARIHDGVPEAALLDRARGYRDMVFDQFPEARPPAGGRVMELGSGVAWIMQAVLERFDPSIIVGLDISANMIRRARERFADPTARFVQYDGFGMPFRTESYDTIYSVACMQHIEKHAAFLLFEELYRVLAVGGHGVIHLLSVDHITSTEVTYHQECLNHVYGVPTHWHHYYSFDELFVLFADVIGVEDLDIRFESGSVLVHFAKGTGRRFRDPALPELRMAARRATPTAAAPPAEPAPPPAPGVAPDDPRALARALARVAYHRARRFIGDRTRRA